MADEIVRTDGQTMHLNDEEAFPHAAIARIDRRSEELARSLPGPMSPLALGSLIVLAIVAGMAIFGAGALFARWLC